MNQVCRVKTCIKQIRVFLKIADVQFSNIFEVPFSKCLDHFIKLFGFNFISLVIIIFNWYSQTKCYLLPFVGIKTSNSTYLILFFFRSLKFKVIQIDFFIVLVQICIRRFLHILIARIKCFLWIQLFQIVFTQYTFGINIWN